MKIPVTSCVFPTGGYGIRWTTREEKRHSIYAPTLDRFQEMENQIIVNSYDGLKSDAKALTVNDCLKFWSELKRGIFG